MKSRQASLVPQLHRQADDCLPAIAQNRRHRRAVHATAHRYRHGAIHCRDALCLNWFRAWHLISWFLWKLHYADTALTGRGERARSRSTEARSTRLALSMSSPVVGRPTLNRSVDRASSAESPIAVSTCEGSTDPDEHAAPVEHATPCRSSAISSASPPAPDTVR